ncbi:hypothetical protein [Mycoavidus sp. B2-EB]|nr:hypothetical protein [Mycoavidus sp. B2-EB]
MKTVRFVVHTLGVAARSLEFEVRVVMIEQAWRTTQTILMD